MRITRGEHQGNIICRPLPELAVYRNRYSFTRTSNAHMLTLSVRITDWSNILGKGAGAPLLLAKCQNCPSCSLSLPSSAPGLCS